MESRTDIRGKRVLIVEDEILVLMNLEHVVIDAGMEVAGAISAEEAFMALDQQRIDMASLDITLDRERKRDSFSIADRLVEMGIPFIFVSALGRSVIPSRFSHIALLGKPVIARSFVEALQGVCGPALA